MQVLDELGLLHEFLALPHDKLSEVTAVIGGTEVTVADLSLLGIKTPYIAFTPQWHFLDFLARAGKQFPGFHLIMETEATDLIETDGQVRGVRAQRQDAIAAANILVPAFRQGIPSTSDLERVQKRRGFPTRVTQGFQVIMQDRVLLPYLRAGKSGRAPRILRIFNRLRFPRWLPARFIAVRVTPEHIEH